MGTASLTQRNNVKSLSFQDIYMKIVEFILRHRYAAIIAMILIIACVAYGIRFIEFSSSERIFFHKDDPKLKALEELESTYTRDNNVFFVISTKDKDIFTRKSLAAIEELTRDLQETPYSKRVDSITNFQIIKAGTGYPKAENLVQNAMELNDDDIKKICMIIFRGR